MNEFRKITNIKKKMLQRYCDFIQDIIYFEKQIRNLNLTLYLLFQALKPTQFHI